MLKDVWGQNAGLFIDGKHVPGEGALLKVVDPVSEDVVAEFAGASTGQVDLACKAAARAFGAGGDWPIRGSANRFWSVLPICWCSTAIS